ncbi:hypothetical protein [Brucella intermedia]|uniref:hypothetical protein n=1 Tax=Brucella intermedia TaxID=94625 RepID=UPI002B055879|nr:hypothetical protein [Brucella intermedia]
MVEVLDEAEDVALRLGQGIEPSPPLMDDDDDLGPASILDRPAGALLHVDRKAGLLEHDCARNTVPQVFQFIFLRYPAGALASAFLSGFFFSRNLRDSFRRPAKSKGGKGAAGKVQICTLPNWPCQPRRSFPCRLPLASGT